MPEPIPHSPEAADRPAAKRGRPPTFDEHKQHEFCNLLRLGCRISKAAILVGMTRRAILYAARRDLGLAEQIRLARQESRLDPIHKIANSKSWRAAAWLLERNSRDWRLPRRATLSRSRKLLATEKLERKITKIVQDVLQSNTSATAQMPTDEELSALARHIIARRRRGEEVDLKVELHRLFS